MKRLTLFLLLFSIMACAGDAGAFNSAQGPGLIVPAIPRSGEADRDVVLLFMDILPWGYSGNQTILDSLGESYTIAYSSSMDTMDLAAYNLIIIANDQPQSFYNAFNVNLIRFEMYLTHGGVLQFHGADAGWAGGQWLVLPGGVTHANAYLNYNYVTDPDHPIVANLPDTLYGNQASHGHFLSAPLGAHLITAELGTTNFTTIEYDYGAGTVIATCMPWEYNYAYGYNSAACLPNAIAYCLSLPNNAVAVSMYPMNPPVQIPAGGGSFDFSISVMNYADTLTVADVWLEARLPNGSLIGPVSGPVPLSMSPPFILTRIRTQVVPATAPTGNYSYLAHLGDYPGTIYDTDSLVFEKMATLDGEPAGSWMCTGGPLGGETLVSPNEAPADYDLVLRCNPNPFNALATIRYQLPANSFVSLRVYDAAGRQVATLVDGWREAGQHEVAFDALKLSSGIYIYRLQAGEFQAAGKMVLLK
jgi:hypothetical protein